MHDSLQPGEINGAVSERLSTVVALLNKAGIKARQVTDISAVEWSKYAVYSSGMAPSVLTRAPTRQFFSDPDAALIAAGIVREIGMLAKTLGITLKDEGVLPAGTVCRVGMTEAVEIILKVGDFFARTRPDTSSLRCRTLNVAVGSKPTQPWALPSEWLPRKVVPSRR